VRLRTNLPKPPKGVHRAAGKGRLKPGRHWLYHGGLVLPAVIILPYFLADQLSNKLDWLLTSNGIASSGAGGLPSARRTDSTTPITARAARNRPTVSSTGLRS